MTFNVVRFPFKLTLGLIIDMLYFNSTKSQEDVAGGLGALHSTHEASAWKVLVLDATGQRILSPVMKVNDLRDNGVTLYL